MDLTADRQIRSLISAFFNEDFEGQLEIIRALHEEDDFHAVAHDWLSTTVALVVGLQNFHAGASTPEEHLAAWERFSLHIEMGFMLDGD